MKTSEFKRYIKKRGCYLKRHGANHDAWINPKTGDVAYIPRHTTKDLGTGIADDILKKLGLK